MSMIVSTPTPEIMYQYAQGAQKGLTASKKKNNMLTLFIMFCTKVVIKNCILYLEHITVFAGNQVTLLKNKLGLIFHGTLLVIKLVFY